MAVAGTKPTRWWWIRHAPVTSDGGRVYGQMDLPADTSDPAPYAPLARRLPAKAIWVASHLRRTHDTAAAIRAAAPNAGFPAPENVHGLAEQHFGEWQGQDRATVFREHGAPHGLWLAPADRVPPGGESFSELMARVALAIEAINRRYQGQDIVAVTHGGTIRAALGLALGLPPASALKFKIDNCSLTRIDHLTGALAPDVWRVNSVNERVYD